MIKFLTCWMPKSLPCVQNRWLIVNFSTVVYLFLFALFSFSCFYLLDAEKWWDDGLLWVMTGFYTGTWFLFALFFAQKKEGEISALVYFVLLTLNSLALCGIFLTEVIDYFVIVFTYQLGTLVLFILSQYLIGFVVLILMFALSAEATYRLYQQNKCS